MSRAIRFLITVGATSFLLIVVGYAFWQQDLKYSRPTPKPKSLKEVAIGSPLELRGVSVPTDGKPVFLHFFNPNCPCSRFNLDHVRALVREHKEGVHFVAVLQGDDAATLQRQFAGLGLGIPGIADTDGKIAAACGVYSTPQAAILDDRGRLYFRGNYNFSRYCESPQTEFARIALESFLANKPAPIFPDVATVAYGCELPANVKNE